ncbi:MAG TPA: hypothetical protein VFS20_33570 [Longimicrobium sp.]|nr:hypothetical protein [Longimicrobium sp.]
MQPPANARSPSPDSRWSDGKIAVLVALAVLAACVAVHLPFITTYAVRSDTAALMLHSTRFFPADVGEWVREGFAQYFVNYPEATRPYTGFVRPVVNATVWLESLLASGPNSPLFLLTNYLGHAVCSGLVYLAARRLGALGRRESLLAAALFAGTVAAVELLRSPAFRADMLAAGFSLAALLLADSWLRGGRWTRVALAAVLLVLAIFSKETAVTAPFLCAAWVAALAPSTRPRRDRIVAAAALLLPLGAFALARAMGPEGAYVSLAGVKGNLAEVASSAFFPGGGVFELLAVVRGAAVMDAASVRGVVAFALNLAGAALVLRALLRRDRPAALLVAAAAAAFAIPALLAPVPRMMYFGQMFALPLLVRALPEGRGAMRAIAGLALLVGPAWLLGSTAAAQPELVAGNRDSARLQRVLAAELRDPRIRRVYLVGDVVGDYGALALVRVAALRAGRPDVAPRVTSSMGRFGDDVRRGTMQLRRDGGELVVDQRCGDTCDFSFPGVAPGDEKQLGERGIITYRQVEPRRLVFAIPAACDYLLVGFTPAGNGVHVLRPCGTVWHRAAPGD